QEVHRSGQEDQAPREVLRQGGRQRRGGRQRLPRERDRQVRFHVDETRRAARLPDAQRPVQHREPGRRLRRRLRDRTRAERHGAESLHVEEDQTRGEEGSGEGEVLRQGGNQGRRRRRQLPRDREQQDQHGVREAGGAGEGLPHDRRRERDRERHRLVRGPTRGRPRALILGGGATRRVS